MRHIETLSPELKLIVSDEHTFGTDALCLASFTAPRKKDVCVELGTGCGIISFYWFRENMGKQIYAVDIQENAINQLKESILINDVAVGEIITPICSDLKDLKGKIPNASADVVCMNPPYKPIGTGIISESDVDKIARHETECTLDDICNTAKYLLKYGGRLCICFKPERLVEAINAMQKAKIEPKRLRFVTQKPISTPWLVLLEGRLGGKTGMTVEPQLVFESDEKEKIIGQYRK